MNDDLFKSIVSFPTDEVLATVDEFGMGFWSRSQNYLLRYVPDIPRLTNNVGVVWEPTWKVSLLRS